MKDPESRNRKLRILNRKLYAPLQSIAHAARLLANTGLNEEQRRNVEAILASAQSLRQLIEGMTDSRSRAIAAESGSGSLSTGAYGPLDVLVVEADVINHFAVMAFLNELGYWPDIVSSGQEAIAAFKKQHYDLILMDCRSPQISGYSLAGEMRGVETSITRRTWIFALSDEGEAAAQERAREFGVDGIIATPLSIEPLKETLRLIALEKTGAPGPMRKSAGNAPVPGNTGIDLDVLRRLRGFNEKDRVGLFEELIFGFLEQVAAKVQEMEQLMSDGDQPRLVQLAHTLKGLSLNFGALSMAKECETFQRSAESGLGPDLETALDRIKDAFSSAQRTLIRFAKQSNDGEHSDPSAEPYAGGPSKSL
jgi:CheY-like chemotaxis protein